MTTPIYLRIKQSIREDIQDRKPNTAIQSERDLSLHFSASRMTVRKAIDELVSEGFLYRDGKRGTFVADDNLRKSNPVLPFEEDMDYTVIYFDIKTTITREVQEKLIIREDDPVVRLVRVVSHEGVPQKIEEIYIKRKDLTSREVNILRDLDDISTLRIMGSMHQEFTPVLIPVKYANLLKVAPNTPVIEINATLNTQMGNPLVFMKIYPHPIHQRLSFTF